MITPERDNLVALCKAKCLTLASRELGGNHEPPNDPAWKCHGWHVTLRYEGRSYSCDYFTGIGNVEYKNGESVPIPPTAADVVYSLCIDASVGLQSFEEMCSDMGYDPDSRKAFQLWESCQRIAARFKAFLDDDFEAFARAEH
jgi:hypothetical protein